MTWEKFKATWIDGKGISVYGILLPVEEYHATHLLPGAQTFAGAFLWDFTLAYQYVQHDITGKWAQIDINDRRLRFRELRYIRPESDGIRIAGDDKTEVELGNGVELMTNLVD